MIPVKPILRFLLLSLGIYTLMLVLASVVNFKPNYTKAFAWGATQTMSTFSRNGKITYKPKTGKGEEAEVRLVLMDQDQIDKVTAEARAAGGGMTVKVQSAQYKIDTWVYGFLPTAFVLALILAGPVSWKRKLLSLPMGLLLICFFIWIKLYVELTYLYNIESSAFLNVAPLSQGGAVWVERIHSVFFSISFNMIMAIFIWVLVTFRKDDWQKILSSIQKTEQ